MKQFSGFLLSLTSALILTAISAKVLAQDGKKADYTDVHGLEFIKILPGEFLMGLYEYDIMGYDPELPQRKVTIEKAFYLAKYETTQALWQKIMNDNPSDFVDPERPVENVSFRDIKKFIKKLNQTASDRTYRLPTEAQWEYAARGGSTTPYFFGKGSSLIDHYGWFIGNTPGGTQKVGLKLPNQWGLHDMLGNVSEWVEDCWHPNYLEAPSNDVAWVKTGWFKNNCKERVLRGGSWYSPVFELRSSYRYKHFTYNRSQNKGFRLALDIR